MPGSCVSCSELGPGVGTTPGCLPTFQGPLDIDEHLLWNMWGTMFRQLSRILAPLSQRPSGYTAHVCG